jgi:hypothetical protein
MEGNTTFHRKRQSYNKLFTLAKHLNYAFNFLDKNAMLTLIKELFNEILYLVEKEDKKNAS